MLFYVLIYYNKHIHLHSKYVNNNDGISAFIFGIKLNNLKYLKADAMV